MSPVVVIVILAAVAGLQRYAVSYGYRGETRRAALSQAVGVVVVALICLTAVAVMTGGLTPPRLIP